MARHSHRVQRLVAVVQGRHEDLEDARLARLTDDELGAEMAILAVQMGLDPALSQSDPPAALAWAEKQVAARRAAGENP